MDRSNALISVGLWRNPQARLGSHGRVARCRSPKSVVLSERELLCLLKPGASEAQAPPQALGGRKGRIIGPAQRGFGEEPNELKNPWLSSLPGSSHGCPMVVYLTLLTGLQTGHPLEVLGTKNFRLQRLGRRNSFNIGLCRLRSKVPDYPYHGLTPRECQPNVFYLEGKWLLGENCGMINFSKNEVLDLEGYITSTS